MQKTVAEKMRLKSGVTMYVQPPAGEPLPYDPDVVETFTSLRGTFDAMHVFVSSQRDLAENFPRLKAHLSAKGALWISWPKNRGRGSDLTLHEIVKIGYGNGLVESICLSVDDTWSALRFTRPKAGRTYSNSHAPLNRDAG